MTSSMPIEGASFSSFSSTFHSLTHKWTYDVFLSFRGIDTRNNFTSHLYNALVRKGINTYIDKDLERGENISPSLLKAIEESKTSVIVFSQNYASSSWCLDELMKIVECKNAKGQIVLPVFYRINPTEVRRQKNMVGKAFNDHKKRFKNDQMKVQRWKTTLTEVANLSGWHIENGDESEFVHAIVEEISKRVRRPIFDCFKYQIGIPSGMKDMTLHLNLDMKDMRKVGISGFVKICKTTLGKAVLSKTLDLTLQKVCSVLSTASGQIARKAPFYQQHSSPASSPIKQVLVVERTSVDHRHRRSGHSAFHVVQRILSKFCLPVNSNTARVSCSACSLAEGH